MREIARTSQGPWRSALRSISARRQASDCFRRFRSDAWLQVNGSAAPKVVLGTARTVAIAEEQQQVLAASAKPAGGGAFGWGPS